MAICDEFYAFMRIDLDHQLLRVMSELQQRPS